MKTVAALALVAFVLSGCGGSSRQHFRAAPGWHAGSAGIYSWASTVPFRDCRDCVPPHKTIAALPPDGVVIQLQSTRGQTRRTVGSWPLRIRARDVEPGFEGVPRRYGFSERSFQKDGVVRWAFVWFGRTRPTAAQVARANAELARFKP